MGNYGDNVATQNEIRARQKAEAQAQKDAAAAATNTAAAAAPAAQDPYGTSGISNQSVRRRGSTEQSRVGSDTRVRDDASSGTAGAAGSSMGAAMADTSGATQPAAAASNPLWQAQRQPTDLASIQQRVLQSLLKPTQGGM